MPIVAGTKRVFSLDDQKDFAKWSGDFNPLHIDIIKARRSLVGGPIVHGVNTLLWALDSWIARHGAQVRLQKLDVCFLKPISVGAEVTLAVRSKTAGVVSLALIVASNAAVSIDFSWGFRTDDGVEAVFDGLPVSKEPRELNVHELPGLEGEIALCLSESHLERLFPNLVGNVPKSQIATLLATTCMVGSECPGLHALYSELHLVFAPHSSTKSLYYEVVRFDRRFGLVTIKVGATGLTGTVKAFLQPPPMQQPTCAEIGKHVGAEAFVGQRALIIGGSRGLGEVVAKILAMGGADVLITYNCGEEEARRIVDDVVSSGGKASCVRLDVTSLIADGEDGSLPSKWLPTHLYYMATPFIGAGCQGRFRPEVFSHFCTYYIDGFTRIFDRVRTSSLRGVLYPSTVFLDELPMGMAEYVAAKSAGESICAFLGACPALRATGPVPGFFRHMTRWLPHFMPGSVDLCRKLASSRSL